MFIYNTIPSDLRGPRKANCFLGRGTTARQVSLCRLRYSELTERVVTIKWVRASARFRTAFAVRLRMARSSWGPRKSFSFLGERNRRPTKRSFCSLLQNEPLGAGGDVRIAKRSASLSFGEKHIPPKRIASFKTLIFIPLSDSVTFLIHCLSASVRQL